MARPRYVVDIVLYDLKITVIKRRRLRRDGPFSKRVAEKAKRQLEASFNMPRNYGYVVRVRRMPG